MFKAHYQMKVTNVKAPVSTNNRVVNNITVSDNARFYKDSVDSSINTEELAKLLSQPTQL